ncbi:MAG: sugar transferase [Balneolaceae bacterium]|nr:sugar transferase [Balneolaceae bacterium]
MRGNAEALSLRDSETMTVRETIIKQTEWESRSTDYTTSRNRLPEKFYNLSNKKYLGKEIVDYILAAVGCFFLFLTYPLIALGIKLSSRGPVIFKQKRTGMNGKTFTCYKFRTMHLIQKKKLDGKPTVTEKGDARIFWFGSLLRKLNLDELPQLFNVIKGDMSLVGPRPYPLEECAYWNSTFDDFFYRYSVKPGISGLAQSRGYRGGTLDLEHMRKRLDYDLIYVQKSCIGLDFKIIGHTLLQMIHLNTKGH